MELSTIIPILRVFDLGKTKAFYVDYLDFRIDWEHRFEPALPLYMQVSRDQCRLHLSEHHGDCCPGSAVRIATREIGRFHAGLAAKCYGFARPGLETTPFGMNEVRLTDPAGNRITFFEPIADHT